ncbi:hypothetical protein L286_08380 [Sphingobium sp. HDIP04]|uniref:Uncharacterized protein n=1 Tax=Sphingobium indicum F2 TaxID=1450518 RepID=A0A8E0WRQ4_9SPHN|nr:hypothetical protein L286_08380 [Sphingobium sp. HDIP04]KER36179.1 hypothetical protein AL00_11670 [Sphingobium indicum F2]KER36808.1 hypothetical protein AL00_08765 [Sphingobium indicum F2]
MVDALINRAFFIPQLFQHGIDRAACHNTSRIGGMQRIKSLLKKLSSDRRNILMRRAHGREHTGWTLIF